MKLKNLFKEIINIGINTDPRGKELVLKSLEEKNKQYSELSEKEKKYFDIQKLENPYGDSRIYYGSGDENISTIVAGIDIETPELLLIDNLRSKGRKIDLAFAHHPEGIALNNLPNVMPLQADVFHKLGVPINIAENILGEKINDVSKSLLGINYARAIDTAKLLDLPFVGAHTPADNCVTTYLQDLFNTQNPNKLQNIIDSLLDIEEYQISYKENNAPKIVVGNKENRCGKIFVDMTGGTEGPASMMEKLSNAGIGTIVGMHLSENHLKKAKEHNINIIIAGHMPSDSLGLNLLFDQIEKKLGDLEIIGCSGYKRIKRN